MKQKLKADRVYLCCRVLLKQILTNSVCLSLLNKRNDNPHDLRKEVEIIF